MALTFNPPDDIQQITLAKSSDINELKNSVKKAFDLLPEESRVSTNTITYAVDDSLVENAYQISIPSKIEKYTDGLSISFRPNKTNTGESTIDVNSLGVKEIRLTDNEQVMPNDIISGVPVELRYSSETSCFHIYPNSTERSRIATEKAKEASGYADNAKASRDSASDSEDSAKSYRDSAYQSLQLAQKNSELATTKADEAAKAAGDAVISAESIIDSANTASKESKLAVNSALSADQSASAAEGYKNKAQSSADTASNQADIATKKASEAAQSAVDAKTYAQALNADSTQSITMKIETKVIEIQPNKQFYTGMNVKIYHDFNNWMSGTVQSYIGTKLTVVIEEVTGNGTFDVWTVVISGTKGDTGKIGSASYAMTLALS